MYRLILLTIGFGIAVSGGISTIAYLNMITAGHGFDEYLSYISKRVECYLLPVGIAIIWLSIYWPHHNDEN
ncbi:hypothetical protein V7654_08845 [Bacillus sp. JJ1609]|uniref:hypothetical protein n=1 Tax=Bacillus sp. JJ1609 TaxID=3122977 RepID=UPI00300054EE